RAMLPEKGDEGFALAGECPATDERCGREGSGRALAQQDQIAAWVGQQQEETALAVIVELRGALRAALLLQHQPNVVAARVQAPPELGAGALDVPARAADARGAATTPGCRLDLPKDALQRVRLL